MYHRTVCKNATLILTEKDKKEACTITKEMIKPDAFKNYIHYHKYKEPFEAYLTQVHEIVHIQQYETTDTKVPPYMEDDKTLLVKAKDKSKSILELFSKVKKI
jgi:hypothetical protein